jgi:hypothetical protein
MKTIKLCLITDCTVDITGKRSDAKFCSLKHRNQWHNNKNKEEYHLTKEFHKLSLTNRDILKKLKDNERFYVTRDELDKLGYAWSIYTQKLIYGETKSTAFFNYDYGITKEDNSYKLLKR